MNDFIPNPVQPETNYTFKQHLIAYAIMVGVAIIILAIIG